MGRDRPTKVASAPRGLGLYRRAGRDGFFFVKNLAAQAKKHPGRIKPTYIDEQIKRSDGCLITSQKEAESYCYRRSAQIQEMLLTLKGETVDYSGDDLEAIAQQLAMQWISAKQRGVNLQHLQVERWGPIARWGSREVAKWMRESGSGGLVVWTKEPQRRIKPVSADELEEEGRKLEQLSWDNGFRLNDKGLDQVSRHFARLIQKQLDVALDARQQGHLKAPKPTFKERSTTWQALLKAKEEEGIASGTLTGMTKAVERLQGWIKKTYLLQLPSTLDGDMAKTYRSWLFSNESELSLSSVAKEFKYLNSVFNAAVRQKLLEENPFHNLPKDRRSVMAQKLDSRKTVDSNKVLTPEQAIAIYDHMNSDKRGNRDSGFDLFYLQAMTGTRIQEVAGLRRCDFTERSFGGKTYKCIEIKRWHERGIAVMGERGGLKNPQSERIVPLPSCAERIWQKHSDPGNKAPAFPSEKPKTERAHWGDNLARRMRDKIPYFRGTHAWRETLINNLLNNSVPVRIVEMVTGKTGNTPLSQYTSDDLPSMANAISLHAKYLNLPTCK